MREKTLMQICVIVILIGFVTMIYFTKSSMTYTTKIVDITEDMNYVRISGIITRKYVSRSGTVFLKITDETSTIDVVVFPGSVKNINSLEVNQKVEVLGNVQKYKGKVEIIARKITPL